MYYMYTHTQDLWSTYLKAQTLQNVVVIYSSHTYTHIYTHNYVSIPLLLHLIFITHAVPFVHMPEGTCGSECICNVLPAG